MIENVSDILYLAIFVNVELTTRNFCQKYIYVHTHDLIHTYVAEID